MARTPQTATWNREDRDLLVELRTEQRSTRDDIAAVRVELKDISTGMTARLLNLEANAVSRVEIDAFETRLRTCEEGNTQVRTWGSIALILLGGIEFLIGLYVSIKFH
jgi:hypothetical protein